MKRVLVFLVFLVGCQKPREVLVAEAPRPAPVQEPPAPLTVTQTTAEIEFADWPTATERPVRVFPPVVYACGPGTNEQGGRWAEGGGEKRHGPHFKHSIVVRANPGAMEEFKAGGTPLPVGTVVVKEKHADLLAKAPLAEYGAMIKREPGYDPQHGDWEYLYVVRGPEKKVTRGRLESCIECHSHAKDKDYLFRTYLPGKVGAFADW